MTKSAQIKLSLLGGKQTARDADGVAAALDRVRRRALAAAREGEASGRRFAGFERRILSLDTANGLLSLRLGLTEMAMAGVRRGAVGLGIALSSLALAGGRAGFAFNNTMDRQRISFETLLGSAGAAKTMMRDLGQLAEDSPVLDPRSTGEAATTLLSYGISAKKVLPLIDALGNMSVVTGKSIAETLPLAARALGQIQGKGKLQAEEWYQLVEGAGLSAKAMAKALGVTEDAFMANFQAGAKGLKAEVAMPAILKAMQASGGNAADQYAKTFAGRLDQSKDLLAKLSGQLVKPVQDRLAGSLGSIAPALSRASKAFDRGGIDRMVESFDNSLGASGRLQAGWAQLKLAGDDIVTIFRDGIAPAARDVWGVVQQLPSPFGILRDVLGKLAGNTDAVRTVTVALVATYVAYRTVAIAVTAVQMLLAAKTRVVTAVTRLHTAAVKAHFVATFLLVRGGVLLMAMLSRMRGLWIALNLVIAANPIAAVIIGLVALGAAFVLAYKKVGWFRDGVDAVFGWLKANWPLVLGILTGPIGMATVLIVRNWGRIKSAATSVVEWVRGRFGALVGIVSGLPGRIGTAATGMFNGIKDAFRGAINFIIRAWNGLEFKIPGFDPPGPGPKFGGVTLGMPDIPELATGGVMTRPGWSWVGEAGPELVRMPRAATVFPAGESRALATGDYAGTTATATSVERPIAIHLTVVSQIDGREVGRTSERLRIDGQERE